jgi:hypothetical protein
MSNPAAHKQLDPGRLVWIRHPTMDSFNKMVPNLLARVQRVVSVDKHDTEYEVLSFDGPRTLYSAWLEPVHTLEAMAMELYMKAPQLPPVGES